MESLYDLKTLDSELQKLNFNSEMINVVECWNFLYQLGKSIWGDGFELFIKDLPIILKLLVYFFKDRKNAEAMNISLKKGILLCGPVGCGKTSLMTLMKYFLDHKEQPIIKSCRLVALEFVQDGFSIIHKYSTQSFLIKNGEHTPRVYCFDDLGIEQGFKYKYFGTEINIMSEILLSRYDLFISHQMITHCTTNLGASDIEEFYGTRLRSRMREMFNLFSFAENTQDKRK